jgi:hypothetical protein
VSLYRVGEQAADDGGLVRIPIMGTTLCAGYGSRSRLAIGRCGMRGAPRQEAGMGMKTTFLVQTFLF